MFLSSPAEENYLKTIFKLSGKERKSVSTNAIADELQTKASSVSDMLKKLAEKNLVDYIKYQGVTLTKSGLSIAIHIVRKHRLWEVFLVNSLHFKWDEVHEIAEQLEHIKSPELVARLDVFLNHPNYDPHGDPIPNEKGEFPITSAVPLNQLKVHAKGKVVAVDLDEPSFLNYLDKLNVSIGTLIEIIELNNFDNSIDILINSTKRHISTDVAKNILISLL